MGIKTETNAETFNNDVENEEESANSQENDVVEDENVSGEESDNSLAYLDNSNSEDDNEDEDDEELDEESTDRPAPKFNGVKKRISKLTKKNAEYETKIQELERRLNEVTSKPVKEENVEQEYDDLKKPNQFDFESYDEYIIELTKYSTKLAKREMEEEEFYKQQKEEAGKLTLAYRERVESAKKIYGKDNWEKLNNIDLRVSDVVRDEIFNNENGPHITYYLYHNLDEAAKIYALKPSEQIKKILEIEKKVTARLNKTSNAPDPISPLSKGKATYSKNPKDMNYKEYRAWREQQNK